MKLVLVGALSPVGTELRRLLGERPLPLHDAILAEAVPEDPEGGRLLSDLCGEAKVVVPLEEVDFRRADLVVLCGGEAAPLDLARAARCCLDLSGASRRRPETTWLLEEDDGRLREFTASGLLAVPQPPAHTLARLLRPLARAGHLRGVSATVLLPAASLGETAVEELARQTTALLNFQEVPRAAIGRQLAFNVVPWVDPVRGMRSATAEDLAWEVEALLGADNIPVSLDLVLVPAFHGYAYSVRLLTVPGLDGAEIDRCLAGAGIRSAADPGEPPSPVAAAQGKLILAARPRGGDDDWWLWAAADSLGAGTAATADAIIRRLAGAPPGRQERRGA